MKETETLLIKYAPVPLCIINPQGKVSGASEKIDEVFLYDGIQDADFFALTGIKHANLIKATKKGQSLTVSRNNKHFRIKSTFLGSDEKASIAMYFFDITPYEKLKIMHHEKRVCLAMINVDNFDELTSTAGEENQIAIASNIDKVIRNWAAGLGGAINRHKEHQYILALERKAVKELEEKKFPILDEIRRIETKADFPVTLSMGIGLCGKTPAETDQYAMEALELALGRGGDQAITKNGSKINYYGGKSPALEKRNKGKSRIIAHALNQLISQASKVIIMGHKNPDMDSFGAAIGIYRLADSVGKEAHILINEYNQSLETIYRAAKDTGNYQFVNSEKALALMDKETLLIVVDTHRPCLTECPQLLKDDVKTIVIDHHRKMEESIGNPILAYMESYASSTSELVTEIIQYSGERKTLKKIEAEALLAGITVDTNRFSVKTGVRTFEAASWLRRSGADTASVKRYFQLGLDSFQIKAETIAQAEFFRDHIALSISREKDPNAQIINSQVADELLTVQGVLASFVVGRDQNDLTIISARSLGDINVQLIMEEFGGGGHLTTAGAQVEMSPEETIEKLKETLIEFL